MREHPLPLVFAVFLKDHFCGWLDNTHQISLAASKPSLENKAAPQAASM